MDRAPTELSQALDGTGYAPASEELAHARAAVSELAELRRSHELLVSALDAASDGILMLRYSDGSLYYNIRFVELWGIPEDRLGDLNQTSVTELLLSRAKNPAGYAALIERHRLNPEAESLSTIELRDGRVLERQAVPQRIHGQCVGSMITFRDVTERLRHEVTMEFNHVVLENSPPMYWIDRDTGALSYANPAMCKHIGYELHELLRMKISEYDAQFPDAGVLRLEEFITAASGPVSFDSRHRRKDGTTCDVQLWAFKAETANRSIIVITARDITAQKQAEREKKRQQATLKSLLDSIPDRIFYKDLDGRYLGCNAAFAAAIGRPAEDIAGLTAYDLYPKEVAQEMLGWQKAAQAQRAELSHEFWVTYPGGQRVPFETKISPLWDEDGHSRGLIGISRNISERKKIEAEVRDAKETAEDATRLKSDFLANMSHEIRTPMNAIIGLSNLVLKTDLTASQRDYIAKVQTAGQHLLGVINDILDFSKVEAGKLDLEQSDFNLEKLLDNTGSLIGEKCHGKGLELVFEVAPDVPANLVGDSLRLGQILLNYANNAVKFTEQGEIIISVRASQRTDKDVLLHFRVHDTGMGLAPDQLSRLFQSSSQGDASTTRKFGGTGLGLAISKQLAELMGGEVGVESEFGKGSTFWFSARLCISSVNRRPLLPDLGLRGRRALVVDDNEHARAVIVDMLEGMTFVASEAASGRAAVDEVREAADAGHPYDVIYLDWRMPGMDGIETARRSRRWAWPRPRCS